MVIETDFMRIEIIPFERNGVDYDGFSDWQGEELRVTIKDGMIGDTQLLNMEAIGHFELVTGRPTRVFTLAKPK